jgi:hypothetical protein
MAKKTQQINVLDPSRLTNAAVLRFPILDKAIKVIPVPDGHE